MRAYINEKAFYTERIYRTIQLRSETRGLAGSGRTADSGLESGLTYCQARQRSVWEIVPQR